jgi:P pilus assembly chaperone PapD
MKNTACLIALSIAGLFATATPAWANVIVGATRVVFNEQDREASLRLNNEGEVPALIESWVDNGDPASSPDKTSSPFTLSPPIFRIEAHRGQTIRMLYSHDPLPQDRESLFWLNVLEIPPVPKTAETESKNMLQFAFRSRLKVFFRPKNLSGSALKAPELLTWTMHKNPGDQVCVLQVTNPTPYHITFSAIELAAPAQNGKSDGGMVTPLNDLNLPIAGMQECPRAPVKLVYSIINDYGGTTVFNGATHE